jgi:D-glycero-D-manno-heptose 1,7-bisphosphate phosphatase
MLRFLFSQPKRAAEADAGANANRAAEAHVARKSPAIFIDRDGVINCRRPGDYVLDWSQFVFMPGMRPALKQLASLGLPMIVISNQAAVGKGLLDSSRLEEITTQMQQALLSDGTSLAAVYYCIHGPDENCLCRKPKPGLLEQAAADFHIDLRTSVFIGDSETDVEAARSTGCTPVLFGAGLKGASSGLDALQGVSQALAPADLFAVTAKCLAVRV